MKGKSSPVPPGETLEYLAFLRSGDFRLRNRDVLWRFY